MIRGYQTVLSHFLGPCCRFQPTCSEYALNAIQTYGVLKGSLLAGKRLLCCHPWHQGGYDPVPDPHVERNTFT